jgi:HK97 family phage portal protein
VKLLADTVASLPLFLYERRQGGGKEKVKQRRIVQVLKNPNPDMSSFRFLNTLQGHLASWGNCYAWVQRDKVGRVMSLYPLRPDRMIVRRDRNGNLVYEYIFTDGNKVRFGQKDLFHVPGFGYDGIMGYSPITMAREAIGLGGATEEFGARFFGEGTHPGIVVKHPGKLSAEAHTSLKQDIAEKHSGLGKSHVPMLLEEGMDFAQLGIPNDDSQFLETRKFQVTEICRFWRVPPHLIYDLERATYSNIEMQEMEFVTHSLRPWLVLWEQELSRYFLAPSEMNKFFFEFKIDGLLRGDTTSRFAAYAVATSNGWMNRNEVRELENLNPAGPEMDEFTVPMNLTTMEKLTAEPEPIPQGLQINGPPEEGEEEEDEGRAYWRSKVIPLKRSATSRARIANSFVPLFKDAAKVVVNREVNLIGRGITKHLATRNTENLSAYLDEFYDDFGEYIQDKMRPVVMSFAEAIQAEAAREIGGSPGITEELGQFLDDFLITYSKRHISSSHGQLRNLIRENEADAVANSLKGRLEEWAEKRADKIADNEAVRLNNAITRETFIEGGVTKLKWVTTGTSTCPYCKSFDGRIVDIQKPFIDGSGDEDEFVKIKGQPWMKITGQHFHPPLHQGCDCAIVAA